MVNFEDVCHRREGDERFIASMEFLCRSNNVAIVQGIRFLQDEVVERLWMEDRLELYLRIVNRLCFDVPIWIPQGERFSDTSQPRLRVITMRSCGHSHAGKESLNSWQGGLPTRAISSTLSQSSGTSRRGIPAEPGSAAKTQGVRRGLRPGLVLFKKLAPKGLYGPGKPFGAKNSSFSGRGLTTRPGSGNNINRQGDADERKRSRGKHLESRIEESRSE
jgi:hypothetical protein